jgi:hypothetical protein
VKRPGRRPAPRGADARPAAPAWRLDAPAPARAAWAPAAAYAVIALFAIALAVMVAGPHRVGDVFAETDFYGGYGPGARTLQQGHLDASRYGVVGPVFEMTLALLGFLVRDLFLTAELISLAATTATLWLWWRIVRERAGDLAGLLATLLLAANGQLFRYGYAATTDALAMALQALALALLLTGRPDARRHLAAGLVAGLSFLTRYNAVVLLPAGVLMLLLGATETPAPGRRGAAIRFAAAFLAPVTVWVAFSLLSGARFHVMLHHNIAYEVFARARGIPWDTYERSMESQFPTPWSVFARDPAAVTRQVLSNVFGHLALDARLLAGWPVAVAAAAGLVLGALDGTLARLRGAWIAAALLFLALVPVFHQVRWSLVVLPAWTALAAIALASPRLALVAGRVWLKPALALLVLALSLRASIAVQQRTIDQLPGEVRTIAREAASRFEPGERVYARKPHFAWHAGLTPVAFPYADSLPALAEAARRDHVRWIYFSWPEAETRPRLEYLLDTTSAVPGLAVRAATAHHPAVLYEILPGFGAAPAWLGDPAQANLHRARARTLLNLHDWKSRLVVARDAQVRGDFASAQKLLDDAARIAPAQPEVLAEQGYNLLRVQRTADARAVFARLEQADPGNFRARVGRGWVARMEGHDAEAAELWRPVVGLADDDATLASMVELFGRRGDASAVSEARGRRRELGLEP